MNEQLLNWYHAAADYWTKLEFGRENKFAWVAAFAAVLLVAVWIYRRDTSAMGRMTKCWLLGLRLAVLLILLVIALQPEIPDNKLLVNPSRVAILVDSSLSMSIEEKQATDHASPSRNSLATATH